MKTNKSHIASEMTNLVLTKRSHILIEMKGLHDRKFARAWLLKMAEAQGFWRETLRGPAFEPIARGWMELDVTEPGALLREFGSHPCSCCNKKSNLMIVDLDETGDFGTKFAILLQLGFFALSGHFYQLSIPESVTLKAVQQAALKREHMLHMLHMLAQEEVEALKNTFDSKWGVCELTLVVES
jgi:hypothetical protein